MLCERANEQRSVEKARLINRRTYLRTEREMLGRETIVRT